nr:MAG TPA: hypothetical protein [Caudoviricetes sp.]
MNNGRAGVCIPCSPSGACGRGYRRRRAHGTAYRHRRRARAYGSAGS